jgi:integrase/recombinase XerD
MVDAVANRFSRVRSGGFDSWGGCDFPARRLLPIVLWLNRSLTTCGWKRGSLREASVVGIGMSKIFLGWFFRDHNSLRQITITDVDEAMTRKGRDDGYARLSIRAYTSSLRSFLQYAESRGWCTRGLAVSVASPRVYQHENLPMGPSWSDVQRLVAATEGSRPKDIRDHAIVLLLAVYALRSGEVRALRLEDLDWEKGLLFVSRTKGRKREPYPLSPTVGQAIIRYLKEARPLSLYREVFLTVEAPIQPLRGSSVWTIVTKRTLSLDPRVERYGLHALRHASATHLLAQGFSLKEIAIILATAYPKRPPSMQK